MQHAVELLHLTRLLSSSMNMRTVRQATNLLPWRSELRPCAFCQRRRFTNAAPRRDARPPIPEPKAFEGAPRAYGKRVDDFEPKPLDRPIGLPHAPQAGENTGLGDQRSWRQRRDDFVNYEKHLVKRQNMTDKISRPYYREWTNLRFQKGKGFIAPSRVFRADRSLYFPNLHGRTLAKEPKSADTTPVIAGKITLFAIYSTQWSERQVNTYIDPSKHPALHDVLRTSGNQAQIVRVNHVDNILHLYLQMCYLPFLRQKIPTEDHYKHFIVRKGFDEPIREAIGILNTRVGYVYLLDAACRIRWAGSGDASPAERDALLSGLKRLLAEDQSQRASDA